MDIFHYISNMIVPRWVKVSITLILLAFVAIYLIVGYMGVLEYTTAQGWIDAAAYVLGITLPILMLALVFLYSQTGVAALRANLHTYLTTTLPQTADILVPHDGKFLRLASKNGQTFRKTSSRKVEVFARGKYNSSTMNYCFFVPWEPASGKTAFKKLVVRVEANVWKFNVNVCLRRDIFEKLLQEAGRSNLANEETSSIPSADWWAIFPHSCAGAASEGYLANEYTIERRFGNGRYVAAVFTREMRPNFMFDVSQKLYFAQDLMYMLRSLLNENPDAFETAERVSAEI